MSLANAWLINPPKKYHKKITRKSVKSKKGSKTMGKKHRISVFGSGSFGRDLMTSKTSRLARKNIKVNPPLNIDIKDTAVEVAGALVGFVGVKLIPSYVVPASWQKGYLKYLVQGATALSLYVITDKMLKKPKVAKAILVGAILSMAIDALKNVLPTVAGSSVGYVFTPSEVMRTQLSVNNPTSNTVAGTNKPISNTRR